MQGDKRVDELMLPVLNAINRHVKDRDAKTDIYNRAYEALLISMEENAALREQVRWKKYPEEKPEVDGNYQAWLYDTEGKEWVDTRHYTVFTGWFLFGEKVISWREIPQPPEGE